MANPTQQERPRLGLELGAVGGWRVEMEVGHKDIREWVNSIQFCPTCVKLEGKRFSEAQGANSG